MGDFADIVEMTDTQFNDQTNIWRSRKITYEITTPMIPTDLSCISDCFVDTYDEFLSEGPCNIGRRENNDWVYKDYNQLASCFLFAKALDPEILDQNLEKYSPDQYSCKELGQSCDDNVLCCHG